MSDDDKSLIETADERAKRRVEHAARLPGYALSQRTGQRPAAPPRGTPR